MKKESLLGKKGFTSQETNAFGKILSKNIMTVLQQDIPGVTKHKNSSHGTIGGHIFNRTSGNTLTDAKPVKGLKCIIKNQQTHSISTKSPLDHGNTSP